MNHLNALQREGLREDIPEFRPGDTVRVSVRVREGDKERLQAFEGVCIGRRGAAASETFTVRKISSGRKLRSACLKNQRNVWPLSFHSGGNSIENSSNSSDINGKPTSSPASSAVPMTFGKSLSASVYFQS